MTVIHHVARVGLAVVIVGVIVCSSVYVPVQESTAIVITRFGKPVREWTEPGPYLKWPWPIEQAHVIDMRQRILNTPYTATFTKDKRNVILLTYVVWQVEQPLLFLQSVGSAEAADKKLEGMVTAAKNFQLGRYPLTALVSPDPANLKMTEIEREIVEQVRNMALQQFGIQVEQVGIKRIAFPEENMPAVLANMRAERKAEANRIRAEGEKEAQGIRDATMVRSEEILREGREDSGRIRGRAEKEAAQIYAQSHKLDPDFYRFWRSLEAVKKVLGSKSTLILRTDQGFFDVLNDPTSDKNGKVKVGKTEGP